MSRRNNDPPEPGTANTTTPGASARPVIVDGMSCPPGDRQCTCGARCQSGSRTSLPCGSFGPGTRAHVVSRSPPVDGAAELPTECHGCDSRVTPSAQTASPVALDHDQDDDARRRGHPAPLRWRAGNPSSAAPRAAASRCSRVNDEAPFTRSQALTPHVATRGTASRYRSDGGRTPPIRQPADTVSRSRVVLLLQVKRTGTFPEQAAGQSPRTTSARSTRRP